MFLPLYHIWQASEAIIYRIQAIWSLANPIIVIDEQTVCLIKFPEIVNILLVLLTHFIYLFACYCLTSGGRLELLFIASTSYDLSTMHSDRSTDPCIPAQIVYLCCYILYNRYLPVIFSSLVELQHSLHMMFQQSNHSYWSTDSMRSLAEVSYKLFPMLKYFIHPLSVCYFLTYNWEVQLLSVVFTLYDYSLMLSCCQINRPYKYQCFQTTPIHCLTFFEYFMYSFPACHCLTSSGRLGALSLAFTPCDLSLIILIA